MANQPDPLWSLVEKWRERAARHSDTFGARIANACADELAAAIEEAGEHQKTCWTNKDECIEQHILGRAK